jgi:hypothetical protein
MFLNFELENGGYDLDVPQKKKRKVTTKIIQKGDTCFSHEPPVSSNALFRINRSKYKIYEIKKKSKI